MTKYYLVNLLGYILPVGFETYEAASANCDEGEAVYMAESMEELEYCMAQWEDEPD